MQVEFATLRSGQSSCTLFLNLHRSLLQIIFNLGAIRLRRFSSKQLLLLTRSEINIPKTPFLDLGLIRAFHGNLRNSFSQFLTSFRCPRGTLPFSNSSYFSSIFTSPVEWYLHTLLRYHRPFSTRFFFSVFTIPTVCSRFVESSFLLIFDSQFLARCPSEAVETHTFESCPFISLSHLRNKNTRFPEHFRKIIHPTQVEFFAKLNECPFDSLPGYCKLSK